MKNLKHTGYFYGALSYTILIPFHQKLATIALGLWLILSFFSFTKVELVKRKQLMILPLLYLTYFIGFLTAETHQYRFLETKLSFLIFPFLFFLHRYNERQRDRMIKVFVLGLVTSAIVCLFVALYRSCVIEQGAFLFRPNVLKGKGFMESILYGGNYFFGRYLSIFHQTVYYAMHLSVGIGIVLFRPNLFSLKLRFVLLGFFIVMVFLISNKASFLALAFIFLIHLGMAKINNMKKVFGGALLIGTLVVLVFMNPRANESFKKVATTELSLNKNARYGFATRLLSWDAAISLIKTNPLWGYGAGETQLRLNETYRQKEYKYPLKENLNAHNLWLQIWLENGAIGILVLMGVFMMAFKVAFKVKANSGFYLILLLVLLINSIFESMFNRFSGISIFAFLICFLLTEPRKKEVVK